MRRRATGSGSRWANYQFWTFDLEGRRVVNRGSVPGPAADALLASTNGELLYVYNAGTTIDLYDADTFVSAHGRDGRRHHD